MRRLAPHLIALMLAAGSPAGAQDGPSPPLSDADLGAERAGLMTPLGLEVGFAASVQTYVDGQLVLQSWVAWSGEGVVTTTRGADGAVSPGGPHAVALPHPAGGTTQVLHHLGKDRIASVVLNTANDRAIRQVTDIMLIVPELHQFQQQVAAARLAANLQAALDVALRDGSLR